MTADQPRLCPACADELCEGRQLYACDFCGREGCSSCLSDVCAKGYVNPLACGRCAQSPQVGEDSLPEASPTGTLPTPNPRGERRR